MAILPWLYVQLLSFVFTLFHCILYAGMIEYKCISSIGAAFKATDIDELLDMWRGQPIILLYRYVWFYVCVKLEFELLNLAPFLLTFFRNGT